LVGVVTVTYLLSMAEITSGSSFEPNNPTEQKHGVCLRVTECENDLEKKSQTPKIYPAIIILYYCWMIANLDAYYHVHMG